MTSPPSTTSTTSLTSPTFGRFGAPLLPSPPTLDVRVLDLGSMTIVGLDGRLGAETIGRVSKVVDQALARESSTIVLDFSLLESISADAPLGLVDVARTVRNQDGRLLVREPSPSTRRVLDLAGASAQLEFSD